MTFHGNYNGFGYLWWHHGFWILATLPYARLCPIFGTCTMVIPLFFSFFLYDTKAHKYDNHTAPWLISMYHGITI